ncbi:hypothetical protein ACQ4WP_27580 [Janthinobacterium sp. GB4P2]|uniref:hypothetical protein n=1 Tax=Janthinobacterium sp. GB4P2 TaxID=3424189 RepID=UPI003F28ACA0
MASIAHSLHQTIQLVITQRPDAVVNTSIDLWKMLASTLNSTIGEVGFHTLFLRSVYTTGKTFPWMMPGHAFQAAEFEFEKLRACLEGQVITESSAASASLLNTFVDMLILLLGEQLTTVILRSAWRDRCAEMHAPPRADKCLQ